MRWNLLPKQNTPEIYDGEAGNYLERKLFNYTISAIIDLEPTSNYDKSASTDANPSTSDSAYIDANWDSMKKITSALSFKIYNKIRILNIQKLCLWPSRYEPFMVIFKLV